MKYSIIILIFIVDSWLVTCRQEKTKNFTQLATDLGYPAQEYDVTTQDGYILKLFHIPGDRNKPILMMHGVIDSADTFIIRGNASLAAALAAAGHDVWLGNSRGNRYSRRHLFLNPDTDPEFWDFSFHELGYYDLPAMIDFILDKTAADGLSAVGHSQGNTIFLVLGATRPDYNQKIKVMISLSPICFLNNLKNSMNALLFSTPVINGFLEYFGQDELFGDDQLSTRMYRIICGHEDSYGLCVKGTIFPLAGSDADELEPEFLPTIAAHYPTGTSKKNGIHLYQLGSRRSFAEYDYGERNMDLYNSPSPPDYDLSKVTMKMALLAGRNDEVSTLADVELLRSKLPNVVYYTVLKRKECNHLDFVWGRNMRVYLFPVVFDVLLKYG